jgi:hypothetical protein
MKTYEVIYNNPNHREIVQAGSWYHAYIEGALRVTHKKGYVVRNVRMIGD